MKKTLYFILMFAFTGCFMNRDFYYLQTTEVSAEELPEGCKETLIYLINTSWLKHRKNGYHLKNDFSKGIYLGGYSSLGHQECFLGMKTSLIIRLLGEPDKRESGKLIYKLCNNINNTICSDEDIEQYEKERRKRNPPENRTYTHLLRKDVIFFHKDGVITEVR